MYGLTDTTHQTTVLTTIDKGMTITAHPCAESLGQLEISGINIIVCRTEYCYLHRINIIIRQR